MPAGRPSTYDPAYCERVIELGGEGKSQVQIAVALGVARTTMLSWAEQHEEFSTALTRAKEREQDWWETTGQSGLFLDKFNAAVWKKSMEARFRDDYTERKELEHSGQVVTIAQDAADL
ncbi:helix-turn-helix domain-containing protein [Sinorhizobium meliloti]|uniref:helix-turn-helix domain-containing protein n=1 Tax=Sinorhizobium sp. 22678 TaxID=3453955 RepID=UPI00299DCA19|nr:helix-turn-helix domain-containing protein [Sinorhizobium meliloti]